MNFSEDGDVGFSPTNLSLNSPLTLVTTVIYYQIGITGNTDRHTDAQTQRLNLIFSPYVIKG